MEGVLQWRPMQRVREEQKMEVPLDRQGWRGLTKEITAELTLKGKM